MRNTFCPLPWIQVSVKPSGMMTTCCVMKALNKSPIETKMHEKNSEEMAKQMSSGKIPYSRLSWEFNRTHYLCGDDSLLDILNTDLLKEVRLDMLNGKKNPACWTCWTRERYSKGKISVRVRMGLHWEKDMNIDIARKITAEDGSIDPTKIKQLELRLGNNCNLKCITCHPGHSTAWYSDWKKLSEKKSFWTEDGSDIDEFMFGGMLYKMDDKTPFEWYKTDLFKKDFDKVFKGVKEIYWAGGEPLLSKEHFTILQKFIDYDLAKGVTLRYDSNITYIPKKLIEMWKKFRWVGVQGSVDDIGIRNDYIRYPSKWEDIKNNLMMLDTIPNLCKSGTTLSCYNILTFLDFPKWARTNMSKIFWENMHFKHVIAPYHLAPKILPKFIKIKAIQKIEEYLSCSEAPPKESLAYIKIDMFKNYLVENIDFFDKKFYDGFLEHTRNIDLLRPIKFKDCFPELWEMIRSDLDGLY